MRGSRSTAGASDTRSTYGSAARALQTSSQPLSSRASPSKVIDVDEENADAHKDGDAASAPVASTSAHRCRSVASAPARPSRSLALFPAQPTYSRSAYAGSSRGKGENPSSTGGKGASSYLEVPEWKESWVDQSWRGEPNACKNESGVNKLWDSNAPETQACTRTNQSTS